MSDETLSKYELTLIDKIVGVLGISDFRNALWSKVEQIFKFTFKNTQIECGFTHATPDQFALKYLEERTFILSDKTQEKLRGNLRWELLEGIRNTESIDEIKRRLDGIFEGNTVDTERIARTEVLNAMNAGRYQANVQSGIAKYKMWRAAMNNPRTAADSKRLNGQLQEIENPFADPKTGESFMHPPNRPRCRCNVLYLRKLPPNVVMMGGEMYDGGEMVGKFEIDIESLAKTEKRVWVRPTTKRKGHYRKVKGAKDTERLSTFIVEPKVSNTIKQLQNHTISGDVNLPGATPDELSGILNGLDNSIGKYDLKLEGIKWSDRVPYALGAYNFDSKFLELTKEKFQKIGYEVKKSENKWRKERDEDIEEIEGMLKRGKLSPRNVDEQSERLMLKKATTRSNVLGGVSEEDQIESMIIHEGYHKVFEDFKLQREWGKNLSKMPGVKNKLLMKNPAVLTVSEYAATNTMECFTETAAAIAMGIDISPDIKKAFEKTISIIPKSMHAKEKEKDGKLKSFTTNNLMITGSEPQQVEVDGKWRIDIDPNHEYKGQCYDKAGKYITECFYNIQKSELSEVRLVHGTTNFLSGSPLVFGHAWVELPNDVVLDLTTQGFYDKNDYYEKLDVVKEVEYSTSEVLENMVENGTYGPWHRTKGMLR